MLQNKLSRIGLLIALVGLAILGASLYTWVQSSAFNRLFYSEDKYEWVRADSSASSAIDTDEIWQVSATCQKPFFEEATAQARSKLKSYNDTAPDEIRAWRNRPAHQRTLVPPTDTTDFSERSMRELKESQRASAETKYWLDLQLKYSDWFHTQSKLEEQVKRWERRLSNVEDRRMTLSEARRRNKEPLFISDEIEAADAGRDFKHFALFLLGLGGFSDEQVKAIETACIDVIPMKKIVSETTYHTELSRWPVDHVVPFWLGLGLVFIGLVLSPVARWIGQGG